MKKVYTLLSITALGLCTLTSCSDDDNNTTPQEPTNYLLGKWDMQTMDMKLEMDGEVVLDEQDVPTKETGMIIQYDFKADETIEYYMYTPATGQEAESEESGIGTYDLDYNKLTITINDVPQTFTIFNLDENKLHLNLSQEDETNKIKVSMTQKFTRM